MKLIEILIKKAIEDEYNAIRQYDMAAVIIRGQKSVLAEKEFVEHANDERKHVGMLLKLCKLYDIVPFLNMSRGISLANCPYSIPTTRDWKVLVNDAIKAEECAIDAYNKLIEIAFENNNHVMYKTFVDILADEEEHRMDLLQILS